MRRFISVILGLKWAVSRLCEHYWVFWVAIHHSEYRRPRCDNHGRKYWSIVHSHYNFSWLYCRHAYFQCQSYLHLSGYSVIQQDRWLKLLLYSHYLWAERKPNQLSDEWFLHPSPELLHAHRRLSLAGPRGRLRSRGSEFLLPSKQLQ